MAEWRKNGLFFVAIFQETKCIEGVIACGSRHKCNDDIVAGWYGMAGAMAPMAVSMGP